MMNCEEITQYEHRIKNAASKYRGLMRHKLAAFIKQNGVCPFCKVNMTLSYNVERNKLPSNYCTIEHITPRAHGGSNQRNNMIASCARCNNNRRVVDFDAWLYTCEVVSVQDIKKIGNIFHQRKIVTLNEVVDFFMRGNYEFKMEKRNGK